MSKEVGFKNRDRFIELGLTIASLPALVGTPAHKASAPFHTPVKAIPRPIGLTADITDL